MTEKTALTPGTHTTPPAKFSHGVRFEEGKLDPRTFVKEISSVLELNATYEEFCDIWSSIFLPDTLIQEDFLLALRERYRLLLLSNTNAIHYEMVRQAYPLLQHFHHHFFIFG